MQRLLKLDVDLSDRVRLKTTSSPWWRLAVLFAHSGDSWLWAIGLALVWLFGIPYWHNLAAILEISVVIQALLVFAIKAMVRRRRPSGEWGSIYRQFDPLSFPSGHATRAMLLAVMAVWLGPLWFGWLIAIWAPLVCISRVMTGLHYLTDILGGMILGIILGGILAITSTVWPQVLPFLF